MKHFPYNNKKCRACSQDITGSSASIVSGFIQATSFDCVICSECGTQQTAISNSEVLTNAYNSIYKFSNVISGYKRYYQYGRLSTGIFSYFFDIIYAERLYYGAYKFIQRQELDKRKKLKILEIGSGLGYTTARLRKMGHEVIGSDLSMDACKRATALHGGEFLCSTIDDIIKVHGNTFDVVLCLEVIEHVDDVITLFKNCKSSISADGCIVFSTPNVMDKKIWDTTEPPIHVSYFTIKGVEAIAKLIDGKLDLMIFNGLIRKTALKYNQHLPGEVLLNNYEPNINYFDNGVMSKKEIFKLILKNIFNKFYYRFLSKATIIPSSICKKTMSTTSIIGRIKF